MLGFDRTDDYQPLTYIRGHPLYVTTLLVALHVAALIAGCVSQALNVPAVALVGAHVGEPGFIRLFGFFSRDVVEHGAVWQAVTYAFVHGPTLWFLLDMLFLFMWGREVEKYFGRSVFICLYAALLLVTPLVLTLVSLSSGQARNHLDSNVLHFSVFIAFVTIYPNVQFFFGILAKWVAAALLAIWTLADLSGRDPTNLLVLWSSVSVAYFGTRYAGVGGGFSILGNLREKFPRRTMPTGVKPRLKPRRAAVETLTLGSSGSSGSAVSMSDVHESIDPLLDKISKHGLASLTVGERAVLERARVSLLRKERGG